MDYIYIGKIVSTHGIKGELKLISDFEYKELVFKPSTFIYIGNNKERKTITNYRQHKNYDMITLEGYNNINDVLIFKNQKVYVLKNEIASLDNKITKEELIGFDIYLNSDKIGVIRDIYKTGINYEVVEIEKPDGKKALVPYKEELIDTIDVNNKKIIFKGGVVDA